MLVLPIENPRESNPYPFYIKNIGQSDGYQDEDLNLVPVWNCGINGQKIEIGLFSSECLTHDKAQNHIKSKFENFTQMEPHIQGMKNIILSTMSNQSTLNYPTDDTITCNNIPSNFSDAIYNITSYLQNEQSKLKNINLFHISKSHPQNQIQVDPMMHYRALLAQILYMDEMV
ncbi:hypothetical protein TVAG_196990 [Trichomonas vaginalis G3]|uniref:Uncharacterized protein n=1 Tax=Trichomonas vaginalis (strain ATCC PRA-98 / G3) TaxID=412133 RepID=A2FDF6_TRIV3|nr:serine-type endopeptidase protein [Trichomonas vaginalis G3]EAX97070.1 hypothetical protein TVAG_196990 [Trichomonas vaginalis G3]KAI5507953.1 serine-type endopeptidase protein [Trichomonas vaginalis G3]|eukprot:XP_001310000.1 hypothetical protein [Trichomonas vaginalis G3]